MAVLVLAEHDLGTLSAATARIVAAAETLGPVDLLVAGQGVSSVAAEAAKLAGVEKVLVADSAALASLSPEAVAALLARLAEPYTHIVAAAAATGRDAIPRLAAKLDLMPVTDVVAIHGPTRFDRPIYAGNAIETVQSSDAKKVITVRASAFKAAGEGGSAPVETVAVASAGDLSSWSGAEIAKSERPELTAARIVISGGRAFASAENFKRYLEPIADKLGAAIGASRAAVDAGYAPNDFQVGQTGKVVAPDLYIACGISGAIQHLAGMKDAKVIVAINKDPDAPIFQVADFGLVGDLFQLLPELEAALPART